jgi:CheY-like chemotaxis protein
MAKILVAEDEKDIRELIAFTLRYAGHEVISTSNGVEAYETARTIKPDLILMDVRMPRMDGYDACREIKGDSSTQNIPVVFLSAKGQAAEIETGYAAGAVEYMVKPFSPELLAQRIKEILENDGRHRSNEYL